MKNNQNNIKQDIWDKDVKKALAKENPELLLNLMKSETESRLPSLMISAPFKIVLLVTIIDMVVVMILTIITGKPHYNFGFLMIPWWLAPLDGILFIGYGVYAIKKRKGELDIGPTSWMMRVVKIEREPASLLGLIYIFIGIFLISAVIIAYLIQHRNI